MRITEPISAELSLLGKVAFIIAPNAFHHLYLQDCVQHYPEASVHVASGVEKQYTNLNCQILTAVAPPQWREELQQLFFTGYATLKLSGSVAANEVVFFHKESKTLLLTDAAFHFVPTSKLATFFAKLVGVFGVLGPTLAEKLAIKNRQATREALQKVLEWPFETVVMAHGQIVNTQAKEKLKAGYDWLLRN